MLVCTDRTGRCDVAEVKHHIVFIQQHSPPYVRESTHGVDIVNLSEAWNLDHTEVNEAKLTMRCFPESNPFHRKPRSSFVNAAHLLPQRQQTLLFVSALCTQLRCLSVSTA